MKENSIDYIRTRLKKGDTLEALTVFEKTVKTEHTLSELSKPFSAFPLIDIS